MNRAKAPHNPLILVLDEVIRLKTRLQSTFANVGAQTQLTPMELLVLTAVVEAQNPPTVPQIGRSLGHHRQVIKRSATSLCDAGLLQWLPNPDHKRAHLLAATDAGTELYRNAIALGESTSRDLMEVVGHEECEQLVADLRQLRGKLEAHLRSSARS